MKKNIIISTTSYLVQKGISAIIREITESDIVFINSLGEINKYLELNKVSFVIIDQKLLTKKEYRDLFFSLKNETKYIALASDEKCLPAAKKFDAIIKTTDSKDKIFPLLERMLKSAEKNEEALSLLSKRETDVLKLVALGYTNKQIAEKLFISTHTVISHRKNITAKLGIKTVSGLAVYAVLNNLIPKDHIQ
ncbi:MAG: response regulator transcription factor [Bacteroidales bacterium]